MHLLITYLSFGWFDLSVVTSDKNYLKSKDIWYFMRLMPKCGIQELFLTYYYFLGPPAQSLWAWILKLSKYMYYYY